MSRFVLSQLLQSLVTLFVISIVVFFLGRATGDPAMLLLPSDATPEQFEQVRRDLGLDKPIYTQYVSWAEKVVRGDFGNSIRTRDPVSKIIMERLPNSLTLALVALSFVILVGIPLGIIAGINRGGPIDTISQMVAFAGMSVPVFWSGIVLMQIFSVWLGWLPTSQMGGPQHYVMPAFSLGLFVAAGTMRLTRSSMLDVLNTEYTKLARIKGLSEVRVILIHALRNALIPVVSFAGVYFALLVSMAVVTETVFSWPGIGRLAYEAVLWRDFPLIQGVILAISVITMACNLFAEILYAYIDPRIRY
ncbi:MAG: ABC transporter permease [Chloroflexota bacterium]|nr:MAG: ABC transporter permease [Chloroflexota bacterium]